MSLRVCFVTRDYLREVPEGQREGSKRIVRCAQDLGIDTQVITIEGFNSEAESHNVHAISLPYESDLLNGRIASDLSEAFEIGAVASSLRPQVVHFLGSLSPLRAAVFASVIKALSPRIRTILHFYGSDMPARTRVLVGRTLVFDRLFLTSDVLRERLIESGTEARKLCYVPIPVPRQKRHNGNKSLARQIRDCPVDSPLIAYAGSLVPERGVYTLLDAMHIILREMPDVVLYVTHPEIRYRKEDSNLVGDFLRAIKEKSLEGRVLVAGREDLNEVYNMSDAIVLPFRNDYVHTVPPLLLLEAVASGTPVVATPILGVRSSTLRMPFLARFNDHVSLAKQVLLVLRKPEARLIAAAARDALCHHFSVEQVGKRLVDAYVDAVGS